MSLTSFINLVRPRKFDNFGMFLSCVLAGFWNSHIEITDYEAGVVVITDKIQVFYDMTGKNDCYLRSIN